MRHNLQVTSGRKQNILHITTTILCLNCAACKVTFLCAVLFTVLCSLWFCCHMHNSHVYSRVFRPEIIWITKRVPVLSTTVILNSILSGRIQADISKNIFRSSRKMPYIYLRFLTAPVEIWTKVCKYRISRKLFQLEKSYFMRTDSMTKLTAAFPIFANAPQNLSIAVL